MSQNKSLREEFIESQFAGGKYADLPLDEANEIADFFISKMRDELLKRSAKIPKESLSELLDYLG